ncbi:hypothetical protein MKW92_053124 [Papaver armeniacum]|nr:hypothetical protein MKW92_053124 [Papaver armeniacum]
MGRPPCCDKVGIKKGPWTPEEDIILVSYIQEHGSGHWRSVPTNTGKWAAIASYLPERTDNDIKNYWNTHLKKKLNKFHSHHLGSSDSSTSFQSFNQDCSSYDRRRNLEYHHLIHETAAQDKFISSSHRSTSSTTTYASSTGNISRLLEGWMKTCPNKLSSSSALKLKTSKTEENVLPNGSYNSNNVNHNTSNSDNNYFESLLAFENTSNMACWKHNFSSDSTTVHGSTSTSPEEPQTTISTTTPIEDRIDSLSESDHQGLIEDDLNQLPFSLLENWLLDETTGQVLEEDPTEISPIF